MESTRYHYRVLTIKHLFIRLLIFIKEKEILTNEKDFHKNKRFSRTKKIQKEFLRKRRDSHD